MKYILLIITIALSACQRHEKIVKQETLRLVTPLYFEHDSSDAMALRKAFDDAAMLKPHKHKKVSRTLGYRYYDYGTDYGTVGDSRITSVEMDYNDWNNGCPQGNVINVDSSILFCGCNKDSLIPIKKGRKIDTITVAEIEGRYIDGGVYIDDDLIDTVPYKSHKHVKCTKGCPDGNGWSGLVLHWEKINYKQAISYGTRDWYCAVCKQWFAEREHVDTIPFSRKERLFGNKGHSDTVVIKAY